MMYHALRPVVAIGSFVSLAMALMPLGCGSSLGPVRATQNGGGIGHPNLPDITVERAKECVAEYGSQLATGHHTFNSKVEVHEDGYKEDVVIEDIPNTAPDFGACMRNVLRDMPIAEEPFRQGVKELKYRRDHPSAEQRSLVSHPVVIVVAGATIVVSELMLEAGATTILFAVTVEVIDKAAKDVAELAKRGFKKCLSHYTACMATALSNPFKGNHQKATQCNGCFERCQTDGEWPDTVGGKSCLYMDPRW